MTITLRTVKGSPLTNAELDGNFTDLNTNKADNSVVSGKADNTTTLTALATKAPGGATIGLTGTSLTLTAATHNGMVIESLSASPTTITLNVGANLTAGATILKTGAGQVDVNGSATLIGDTPTLTTVGKALAIVATSTTNTYRVIAPSGAAATAFADLTDKSDASLPTINGPLASALASLQTQITALGARISNLKTINGISLEGGGNLVISGGGTVPGQVTGLTAGTATTTTQPLTWSAPSGSPTDYRIEYKLASGSWPGTAVSHSASTATSITVTGLTAATNYDYRVAALNGSNQGTFSSDLRAGTAAGSGTPTTVMRMSQLFGVTESGNGTSGWHYQHQFASIFNDNCYAISSTAMAGAGVVQWTINPFVGTPDQAGWGLFFSLDNIPGAGGYTSMASNNPSGQNNPAGIQYTGTNWIVTGDSGGGTNPVVITAPAVLRYVRDGSNNVTLSASNNAGTSFSTVWTGTRTGTLYLRIAGEFAVEYGNLLTTGFA